MRLPALAEVSSPEMPSTVTGIYQTNPSPTGMAKPQPSYSSATSALIRKRRWHLVIALLVMLSITTVIAFLIRGGIDSSCNCSRLVDSGKIYGANVEISKQVGPAGTRRSPLSFMKSKLVLLVSHELSLSGLTRLNSYPTPSGLSNSRMVAVCDGDEAMRAVCKGESIAIPNSRPIRKVILALVIPALHRGMHLELVRFVCVEDSILVYELTFDYSEFVCPNDARFDIDGNRLYTRWKRVSP